jgi:pimeloyl-ACP methyl ester carboxylesterase
MSIFQARRKSLGCRSVTNIRRRHVLGKAIAHSFGTLASASIAAEFPEKIAALFLVAPADPDKFGIRHLLPQSPLSVPTKIPQVCRLTDKFTHPVLTNLLKTQIPSNKSEYQSRMLKIIWEFYEPNHKINPYLVYLVPNVDYSESTVWLRTNSSSEGFI